VPTGGDVDGVFFCCRGDAKVFSNIYINRSHLPRERHRVSWGIVSGKLPRQVTCNLIEVGANLIHSNMMRSKVPTRPAILVYEVGCLCL
jgi:hypothetical protein